MISNDSRGWILACVSGLACAFGACFINLDIIAHIVPQWRSFNIRESTTFLAASLSLSFGVMFFSALFNLLPEAQAYFAQHGLSPSHAGYAVMGSFLGGVLGLQLISELLHRCLPSSIVTCDDHGGLKHVQGTDGETRDIEQAVKPIVHETETERTPLIRRMPSLKYAASFVTKNQCVDGKCYGYSDHPCDQKCSVDKHKKPAVSIKNGSSSHNGHSHVAEHAHEHHNHDHGHNHEHEHEHVERVMQSSHHHLPLEDAAEEEGHHHVAKNKFLSIGVQTSIAIALHKFPEGIITYATNHADPALGFNVFLALFVHNIAEGFAMSLPLFLALRSRTKAVIWASLLGGLAQPAGALVAWASINRSKFELNHGVYGALFAVTAGIMCSVGLQLFSQAIQLHHGSRLSFIWAFIGMSIMGFSSAITAE
ncbi:Zinc/iron permease [Pyronema domesticum]|uniref:Uncharacterized protein n=1 Tax=Pyronema omphalodes (strain CBS 100304) TaxID=1076935 RepID=U4L262_PYROM|nr:Zinc/iron permease [Pyronema domesticum]